MASSTTDAFSSDGADAIKRSVEVIGQATDAERLHEVYEIKRCVAWIKDNKLEKVALQFPDELLADSYTVTKELEAATGVTFFILADTSYGSCCVDEVAAQHYSADGIIHYGRSCLSPTRRVPTLLIFGQQPIDIEDCCRYFCELYPEQNSKVILLCDLVYHYIVDDVGKKLKEDYPNLLLSVVSAQGSNGSKKGTTQEEDGQTDKQTNICTIFGRTLNLSLSDLEHYCVFYIGAESWTLLNLMKSLNRCKFSSYNPETKVGRQETQNVNKMLMKRYFLVEKAKDAQIVGILVGTLGVADYLTVIDRLKNVIKKAGKKSYTFVMGKLNVAKLANFMEVDIYVLVACPENSMLDSSEFYKPVVTPYEMELACNQNREWSGEYVTDFRQLLPGGDAYVEMPEKQQAETDVSLVTGGMRKLGLDEEEDRSLDKSSCSAVVARNSTMTVANVQEGTAGAFLQERSWKGLDQQLGKTPVTKAVEGRSGLAAGYTHEPVT